jgi:riboflavin kinase/FMN adenylyltransferase
MRGAARLPRPPAVPVPLRAMQVIHEGAPLPALDRGSVVTTGTFDGIHRGHQRLLAVLRDEAAARGCPAVVVTFDRHPASVVRPESAPRLLSGLAQKLELLEGEGIDVVHVLRFDEERSLEPADEFLSEVLAEQWRARAAVAGEDHHFGHRRRGDLRLLEKLGSRLDFEVVAVPLVLDDETGAPISSDAVRHALAESRVDDATRMLGRPYEVQGLVEHGDHRGRELGFPTANVAVAGDIQLPADGVYAGWYVRPDGTQHRAAISIGRRPTFYADNGLLLVEAHLLDFDDDLYGEHARVRVASWLRSQTRFGSIDDLKAQLSRDVEATRQRIR